MYTLRLMLVVRELDSFGSGSSRRAFSTSPGIIIVFDYHMGWHVAEFLVQIAGHKGALREECYSRFA